jgi:hypothetical protein
MIKIEKHHSEWARPCFLSKRITFLLFFAFLRLYPSIFEEPETALSIFALVVFMCLLITESL